MMQYFIFLERRCEFSRFKGRKEFCAGVSYKFSPALATEPKSSEEMALGENGGGGNAF